MTRINAGIPPSVLSDSHLFAEFREISRVGTLLKNRIDKNNLNFKNKNFTLGNGHVLFFLDKGKFIIDRFINIRDELYNRNFKIQVSWYHTFDVYQTIEGLHFYNDWIPTNDDIKLVSDRIIKNMYESKQEPKYYGKPLSKIDYELILKNYEI